MTERTKTKDLIRIAVMSMIIGVCAWIAIPMPVPFTLQIFGVFAALKLLGAKKGTLSIVVYILLGLVGIPVFSSFQAGPAVLLGPTGGYIIGFVIMGILYIFCEPLCRNGWQKNLTLVIGLFFCYLFGTFWFSSVMASRGRSVTFLSGLMTCVVPFIIPDLVKLAAAELVSRRVKKWIK
ncbi:MAG: biotin transporter BioY [Eubacterium sp.]|nr:biotin transporter BioY [Eubacterium sp.]